EDGIRHRNVTGVQTCALPIFIVGILLICAGLALMVGLFTHRQHNFWPVVGGFLVAIAYLLIGYFFLRAPEVGIFAIAAFLAGLRSEERRVGKGGRAGLRA